MMTFWRVALSLPLILIALPSIVAAGAGNNTSSIQLGIVVIDTTGQGGLGTPFQDPLFAAFAAVNKAGGLHGRQLEVVQCPTGNTFSGALGCLHNFSQLPNMLSLMGPMTDGILPTFMSTTRPLGMTMMNPWLTGRYAFDQSYVITRADSRLQLVAMISKAVREFHLTRIAVVWTSGVGAAAEKFSESQQILGNLGLSPVGSFAVSVNDSHYEWRGSAYDAFLATRPQAILVFCLVTYSCGEVVFDLVNRSSTTNTVDSNVKLMLWDQQILVVKDVLTVASLLRYSFNPSTQLFVALANPLATDTRYLAAQHALNDLADYFGSRTFLRNGAGYLYSAMTSWIAARTFIEVVKDMQPDNLTAPAFRDKIFGSSTYEIDDLLIGMFSGPCEGQRRAMQQQCECNVGYGIVEMYSAKNLTWMEPASGGVATTLADCGGVNQQLTVAPPLVLLVPVVNASESSSRNISVALLDGLRGFEKQQASLKEAASLEGLEVANASLVAPAIDVANSNLYLSAVFGSAFDPAVTRVTSLPVVDPFVFPATLTPPFQENVLYVSATLEQELFAMAQFVAASTNPLVTAVIARGPQAAGIINAASRSLNTFGLVLEPSIALSISQPLTSALPCTSCNLIVTGLSSKADVAALAGLLQLHRGLKLLMSFVEFSVLYDEIVVAFAGIGARVYVASSVPNWNAPLLTPSSLMSAYFTQFPSKAQRTPLSLRGFYAAAALHAVVGHVSGPLTATALLNTWYAISVVALSATEYVGAYSNNTCFSSADLLCKTNVGCRKLYVMSVADLDLPSPSSYQSTTFFSSGRVPYENLPASPSSLSTGTIAGIAVAAAALATMLVGVCWRVSRGARDNAFAPKDSTVPVTLMFTDIQSSTALWANAPDAMAAALETHHQLIRELIRRHRAYEVKTIGDAFMIATSDAAAALALAFELQGVFFQHDWETSEFDDAYRALELEKAEANSAAPPPSANLMKDEYRRVWNGIRVRVGLHTGLAEIKFDSTTKGYDYYGTVANVAARTESAGNGGQVLITRATLEALGTAAKGYAVSSLGPVELKGVPEPMELFNVATVPGRTFSSVEAAASVPAWSSAHQDHSSQSSTSASLKSPRSLSPAAGGLALISNRSMAYNPPPDPPWQEACVHFIALLYSRSTTAVKHSSLDSACRGWNAMPSSRHAAHTNRLKDDPYVAAIASTLSPHMCRRFGKLRDGVLPFSGEWNSFSVVQGHDETSPARGNSPSRPADAPHQ